MPRLCPLLAALGAAAPALAQDLELDACTSIMVSKGATTDGSVMITYSADAPFLPRLLHVTRAASHEPGSTVRRRGAGRTSDRARPDPARLPSTRTPWWG